MKDQPQSGFLISKIHQLGQRIFTKKLKKFDLENNAAQGRIMFVLWRKDNISIQELSKETSLGKSTLTSMLDRLEKMGYVKRIPSSTDRRVLNIARTKKDESYEDLYVAVSKEMGDLFYAGFSKEEIAQLDNYLERLFKNLVNHK